MKNLINYIIVIVCVGIIPVLFFIGFRNRYLLKNYGVSTTGVITNESSAKGKVVINYEFYLNGEKRVNSIQYPKLYHNSVMAGKSFPVVYYPKNPEINVILITPADFKNCNRPFPDSLHWVLEYIND